MKKNILLTVIFIVIFSFTYSQKQPIVAPLNPDFIKYINQKNAGTLDTITDEGYGLGVIPVPVLPNFDYYLAHKHPTLRDLPLVYDLRNEGLVTPVKEQSSLCIPGDCWAFATIGAIESHLLKLGYSGAIDLSENNIKTCHGFELGPCAGGNLYFSTAYLSRRDGPVAEWLDPYDWLNPSPPCITGLTLSTYILNARFLPSDANIIKQAILDNGGIYTIMHISDSVEYYNSTDYTYYYYGAGATNHAVLLVGWDDNKVTAGGTGAWIIKNSYGTSWGESGYFYISYNDTRILSQNAYWLTSDDYASYAAIIYMYDKLGMTIFDGYNSNIGYGLVKFIINSENQYITKLATYVNTAGATVDFEIYDTKNGDVLSDLLGSLTNQTCDYPGYYTFDLPTPIYVANGEDIYIKVKYNTPGYDFPIPLESTVSGFANPTIEAGVCWESSDGSAWNSIGNNVSGKEWDLCIRMNTLALPLALSLSGTNISCFGSTNGISTANVSFGNPPYSYLWNTTPPQTTQTATGLSAGTYTVTVADANSNVISQSVTITEPPELISYISNSVNVNCSNDNDGQATVSTTGGTPPYSYLWSTNPAQTNVSATGLSAGSYSVTTTDNNGCTNTSSISIIAENIAPGSLDNTFGNSGKVLTNYGEYINSLNLQTDGKIIAAGANDFSLARFNSDGSFDNSFGSNGETSIDFGYGSEATSLALQSDDKVVVAGTDEGNYDFALARFNTNGSLDYSFGSAGKVTTDFGGYERGSSVAIQTDGKIVMAGGCGVSPNTNFAISKYNINGTLDNTFGSGGKVITDFNGTDDCGLSVRIQSDGKIVVSGYSLTGGYNYDFAIARYNTNGSI
ncbi:MAG: C1 family peptidase, partial [Bacteroidota bacterium]